MTQPTAHIDRGHDSRRRARLVVAIALATILGLAAVALTSRLALRQAIPPVASATSGDVTTQLPREVTAGDGVEVILRGLADGPFTLLLSGSFGATTVRGEAHRGQATVALPSTMTSGRGMVTIHHEGRLVGQVDVAPGHAGDTLLPYVGPRSIVADANHHTMLTLIPTDVYGNPVSEGTQVDVDIRRPDGLMETTVARTDGMLGWVRIQSARRAGRTEVRATLAGTSGPVGQVLEAAGPPITVLLQPATVTAPADGRSRVGFTVDRLIDANGNPVTDGTEVLVTVTGPMGHGRLTTTVAQGRASFELQAPEVATTQVVTAFVKGVSSPPIELTFAAAVGSLPATATARADVVNVRVGPVLDTLGAWLPDGTEVRSSVGHRTQVVALIDGRAEFTFPAGTTRITVEVGGTRREVNP